MTGINSSLFDDEKSFRKSVVKSCGEYYFNSLLADISMSPFSDYKYPIESTDPNIEMPNTDFYYANNSLYFLNSINTLNLEIEIYDLQDNPDTAIDADALLISNKKSVKIVVKGLGIPANFSRTIKLLPTIHPYLYSHDFPGYGAEYGEEAITEVVLPDHTSYQIQRETLGISDWEYLSDGSAESMMVNLARKEQHQKAWLNRLHGDIIDMAFYVETNE